MRSDARKVHNGSSFDTGQPASVLARSVPFRGARRAGDHLGEPLLDLRLSV
jgi:hypothetical protein